MFATNAYVGDLNGPGPCPVLHRTVEPGKHAWNQYSDAQRALRLKDPRDIRGAYPVGCLCGLTYHPGDYDLTVEED